MSYIFVGKEFTFIQPDGTQLRVRGWGNQHYAIFETIDGYTVTKDKLTGFYQYATMVGKRLAPLGVIPFSNHRLPLEIRKGLRPVKEAGRSAVFSGEGLYPGKTRWRTRREEARNELISLIASEGIRPSPPKRQTVGKFQGLCLPIAFPDVPATVEVGEIEAFCNLPGYSGFNNSGSVYDYFKDNSGGKFLYTNIVAPYYVAKENKEYYTNRKIAQPARAIELIEEALAHHIQNGLLFEGLSADSQDFVYALNVFYAGSVDNNWGQGLWPHSHRLDVSFDLPSGKKILDYQITNIGNELMLGTFCHENGHMICDFPDLYDLGGESYGVGSFCLMGSGGVVDEKNPAQIGAYLKYKAGWSSKVTNLSVGTFDISAEKNDFFVLRKNKFEYYIFESRIKKDRDSGLPDEGLVAWHIDELGSNENQEMTAHSHYECAVIQADNRIDLESGINTGDADDLFKASGVSEFGSMTVPRFTWWDGTMPSIEITNITAPGKLSSFTIRQMLT